jgi:hypothetical protein
MILPPHIPDYDQALSFVERQQEHAQKRLQSLAASFAGLVLQAVTEV